MNIKKIRLQGYKSAADIVLENVSPFSMFAGPNGSGKSNLADGLAFFSAIVRSGAEQAIRAFGGYSQIHCFKFRKARATTAALEIEILLKEKTYHYSIKLFQMDAAPQLEEKLTVDGEVFIRRKRGDAPTIKLAAEQGMQTLPDYPDELSALMLAKFLPIYKLLANIRVFRFDPLGAKEPDIASADASELDGHGRNVATMLSVLEKNRGFREEILEWIELLVPGMAKVTTEQQRLDGRTIIKFKEEGTKDFFPANLISDGTIYALCIMTAVLSREGGLGITFIEEPERGIHPQAIAELVSLMRDYASTEHPVFVTTHSESIVRSGSQSELWVINKVGGKTQLKNAALNGVELGDLNLDKVWLMNFFDGELPW
ncbi:AAA family ATPase [Endozoicomonas gorgoniicola]|uniref:AAA family ATPase n=1 Tax=Endozoicomonas gorgoniicola TaxID=1234144 RepID=A0ABT3N1S3_9GAMM|nr:AAA family ATPase [Endozoicomonas gorgoniicola]MCW7555580.1 AAA family ATPase [Endozoicomonas gorgoniicola]